MLGCDKKPSTWGRSKGKPPLASSRPLWSLMRLKIMFGFCMRTTSSKALDNTMSNSTLDIDSFLHTPECIQFSSYMDFYKKVKAVHPDYDLDVGSEEEVPSMTRWKRQSLQKFPRTPSLPLYHLLSRRPGPHKTLKPFDLFTRSSPTSFFMLFFLSFLNTSTWVVVIFCFSLLD
ncbi:hypothetical protein D8674_025572 [Pyrus ussuriensis x Pyrus communis]|uniref:Uncharacterized protein n=1 Tax=Pyrus ussuriensis x Pyrus communis TaxID=2448454 RepID=A0A5N5I5H9_9ROSA|nr:hypothetical protein D8674_025572 [Pyrus ussuriensis x Pyrus communis]